MPLCDDSYFTGEAPPASLPIYQALVTRFNLHLAFGLRAVPRGGATYDRWLRRRIRIFKSLCLPSVLNQTRHPDVWLLGFDAETREALEPVLAAIEPHDWIAPVWQKQIDGIPESAAALFHAEISSRAAQRSAYILSTRLDNDDALNRHFLQDLLQYTTGIIHVRPELREFWVSFPVGMNYWFGSCGLFNCPANHFLSRLQTLERFHSGGHPTPFGVNHVNVFQQPEPVFMAVTSEPMWMEHAHGANVSTGYRDLPLLARPTRLLATFGIREPLAVRAYNGLCRRGIVSWWFVRRRTKRMLRALGLMDPKEVRKARRARKAQMRQHPG